MKYALLALALVCSSAALTFAMAMSEAEIQAMIVNDRKNSDAYCSS